MNLQLERLSFLKNKNFYALLRDIFIPFCFKFISKLFRKKVDENLIIMGAYSGNSYLDNTKYLFEFLSRNSKYKVVWLTKSREILMNLRQKGYNAVYMLSINAIRLLRRCRYVFLTHGIYDVLPIEFSPKTKIIMTFHGTVIKDITEDFEKTYIYKKWVDILKLKSYPHQYIDYVLTPASGKYEHEILTSAFKVSPNKILDLGYPRNDILFNKDKDLISKIKKYYNVPENANYVILYAPTHRDANTLRFPFTKEDLTSLNKVLKEMNSVFLFKGHIFEKEFNFSEYGNINLVKKSSDIQELLLISNLLISDYSSVIFDFLLTMKPIILFPYDIDRYQEGRGLNYNLKEIAPGPVIFNVEDLIKTIKSLEKIEIEYKGIREKIREKFNKYNDGNSIERILDFLGIEYT